MALNDNPATDRGPATIYRFEIRGPLPREFAQTLEGFDVETRSISTVTGAVPDTAALYGLIARLEALGLTLICVQPVQIAGDNGNAHRSTGS